MQITDERLTKALTYLAETDQACAYAKALVEGLSEQRKTLKSILMMKSLQKSNDMRTADAYASEQYQEHVEKLQNAIADYETMRNKRMTEQLIIEVWRSCNANRRNGNI